MSQTTENAMTRRQSSKFGRDFTCECATCAESDGQQTAQWRKVLYQAQPFADNHTDRDTFLCEMVMNADVSSPSYWPTVEASLVVAHQVATVALVVSIFSFHFSGLLTLDSLYSMNASFFLGGLMLAALAEADVKLQSQRPPTKTEQEGIRETPALESRSPATVNETGPSSLEEPSKFTRIKRNFPASSAFAALLEWSSVIGTCCLVAIYMLLLSPVLHTLTRSISSDTIWCSTAYLLLFHLFLHDYSYAAALSSGFSSYLALLSALFACVLLASRLPEPSNAFAFVSFGLQCFGLLPGILHRVARASQRSHRVVVVLLLLLSVGLVLNLSMWLGLLLSSALMFVILVCPAVLVHMHRSYKTTIQGPWDEAKLQKTLSHDSY